MSWIRAFFIAFSIYSKIPVPVFEWKEEDMKYQLVFFPLVGAVIGGLLFGWERLCNWAGIGSIAYVLIGCAIPVLVTGGFHMDGFMDTSDALRSYKSREEKLKILKDPHIGAFAVISLLALCLVYGAAFSQISSGILPAFAASFFLARTLSAIAVILFPGAKREGMLQSFSSPVKGRSKKTVLIILFAELLICCAFIVIMSWKAAIFMIPAAGLTMLYYYLRCRKEFGGITGDTAGYFVCICETVLVVSAGIASLVWRGGI